VDHLRPQFNNTRWNDKKNKKTKKTTRQMTWQNILEYARIACDKASNDIDKAAIYDDVLGILYKVWEKK
jgi:hypothetical protein